MYQNEQKKRRLLQQLKNKQLMSQYEANKQRVKKGNLGDKIASGANGIKEAYKTVNGINKATQMLNAYRNPMPSVDFASKVGATNALSNIKTPTFQAPTTPATNFSLPTQTPALNTGALSSSINAGSSLNSAGNAVNTASKVGNVASKASGALSKAGSAMPVVGTVAGLASAGSNFAQGKHVDGAMDLAKTGAMFIPGVGWAIAGAIQIAQMLKGMKDKRDQKAMAKAEEASQKETQQSMANLEANKQEMAQTQADHQQAMTEQLQKNNTDSTTGSVTNDLYQTGINTPTEQQTPLPELEQEDTKGVPTDMAGNLPKQPLSVDGSASQYLGQEQQYNDAVANMQQPPVPPAPQIPEEPSVAQAPTTPDVQAPEGQGGLLEGAQGIWDILNSKLGNVVSSGVDRLASIPDATSKMLDKVGLDHLASIPKAVSSGLNDFSAGYKDNTQTSFSQGDLAKRFQQPQEVTPSKTEDGTITGGIEEKKKSIMNRLGELAGTGQRIASHPLTQAGIAGLVSKMAGGDVDDIAKAMYDYGTKKAESDRYYQMTTGKTDRPFLNTYGADDYKTQVQKDNWQKEFDWKVAKDARDYELDKQKTEAMAKYYANGGMRANSADRLAWEIQKYKNNQAQKLREAQYNRDLENAKNMTYFGKELDGKNIFGKDKYRNLTQEEYIQKLNDQYYKDLQAMVNGNYVAQATSPYVVDEDGFYNY